jgi:MFS family permease
VIKPRVPIGTRAAAAWKEWWQVYLLGLLTVGSYGIAFYSFGVLIDPIHEETGWSIGTLSSAFTVSGLLGGLGAVVSGRLLDRFGARPVLLGSLIIGSLLLFVASTADSPLIFVGAWGLGGGVISAGLLYQVTMSLTTRLFPQRRVRAFAILTFIGGFAAVIYFPLAGFFVDALGWRDAIRVMLILLTLHVLPAAIFVRGGASTAPAAAAAAGGRGDYGGVREAFRSREVLRMIAMFALAMMAFGAVQVHHVPAMTSVGVPLGTATAVASVRGLLSLPGRAFMEPVTQRFGVGGASTFVYAVMAAGTLALLVADNFLGLMAFMISTGFVFGTIAPLHGLYAAEVFGERRIGTLMGVQTLVVSLLSATGPVLIGLAVDVTNGYELAIVLSSALFGAALLLLVTRPGTPSGMRIEAIPPATSPDPEAAS